MPIVPEGIFGSALATMQQRYTKTATTARSAPSDEEGARSRLARETCLHDRYAAAAHSRRELGPTGEEEKEGGLTAASSSVEPVREEKDIAPEVCAVAPRAECPQAQSHTLVQRKNGVKIKINLSQTGHELRVQIIKKAKTDNALSISRVAAQPPAALFPGRAPPSPRGRAELPTVPPVVAENHFSVPPQGGAGQEPQYVPPLSLRWESWRAAAAPSWVLRTISRGYRLQFATVPPRFSGVIHSHAQGESARVLREEILSLIDKRAVSVVSPEQSLSGFYSRYFLVPKRGGGGGIRPILDLRALNKFLRKYKFRMLTHAALLRLVRPNDWFSSVDLKDAYFHIPIYPPHRQYLRFAFQGVCYEYGVLPFGLSLSPRVFIRCTEAAVAPLRRRGIRLAVYLDDWLLLAQSEQEARVHTHIVTTHLMDLGFVINMEKSHLSPTQEICFLGLSLRSVPFTARLSEERVTTFRACLAQFRLHRSVQFRLCLRLLGVMASAILVIRLGRLHMRNFQRWVASLRMDPVRHGARRITVTADCITALRCWRAPSFLTQGVPMGTVSSRKVVTTDASLSGWGGIHEGRSVRGRWSQALQRLHINFLELSAVFLSLRHFLPFLSGHHVLVRMDNTTTVAYINRQGGLRSRMLHNLARDLILWSSAHFLSLRATHVPGDLNTSADLLSRGAPVYGEWTLHPQVVEQIWARCGRAQMDLFASRENARCELFFSLSTLNAPLGVDALAHAWPHELLYTFPPLALIPPTLARVRAFNHKLILIAPHWPAQHWLAEIFQMLCAQPWELPLRRDLLSQGAGTVFHPHPERLQLWAWPELIDKGKAFSTVKVYLAAIAACHIGFGDKTASQHPLVSRFMKGTRRLLPISRPLLPPWDLSVVLEGLKGPPFEPLLGSSLKHLSLKTALLLALASAKRVSDIHALSVNPACTRFDPEYTRMVLKPNPAFVPKVVGSCSPIELAAFAFSPGEQRAHTLCPVRAMRSYMDRTQSFRRSDQPFVSWAEPRKGQPITKQRLAHWVVEAIALAYGSRGLQPPAGLRAHSTRGMAASWALFRGVSVQDICSAANWSSPLTFVRFYMLDVSGPCMASAVLES
ncbi:uncharacterized protein LOC119774782 [Cyprinodon tularosa]|uniref:uncharacterized protein LOC119774782 n=1 Tax=Cyprinodon tularosa TaxID=77115 RepID=UPI0018E243C7|nr:uncharacterized protein LOC119774782 [Cyprinodon tularosa]